tara:strand:- start:1981 stop:2184 length:204 start_codon:yes stop_codon:yes gene_type:complete
MATIDFSSINKAAAKSFKQQRDVIKRLGKGDTLLCDSCKKPLTLSVSSHGEPGVKCQKGCTNIELML